MSIYRVLLSFLLLNFCFTSFSQTIPAKIGLKEIDSINRYLTKSKQSEFNDKEFISKFCDSTVFSFSPDFLNTMFYLNFRSCLLLYRDFLTSGDKKSIDFQRFIKESYTSSTASSDKRSETIYEYLIYDQREDKSVYFFIIWFNDLGRLKMISTSFENYKKINNWLSVFCRRAFLQLPLAWIGNKIYIVFIAYCFVFLTFALRFRKLYFSAVYYLMANYNNCVEITGWKPRGFQRGFFVYRR